jgi:hypothetical protein
VRAALNRGVIIMPDPIQNTYLVASAYAPPAVKARADYVCDGFDDHLEVQAAIDALPAAGGKVVLSQSNFDWGGTVTISDSKVVEIEGAGMDVTNLILRLNVGRDMIVVGEANSPAVGGRIAHLTMDGNRANNPGYVITSNATVTLGSDWITNVSNANTWRLGDAIAASGIPYNAWVTEIDGAGNRLRINTPATATFASTALVFQGSCIKIYGKQYVQIKRVRAKNAKRHGIYIYGKASTGGSLYGGAWVVNSKIDNSGGHHIFLNQFIAGARIEGSDIGGGRLESATLQNHGIHAFATSDVVIANNNIWECGYDGVNIKSSGWITIVGNFIHTNPRYGIMLDQCVAISGSGNMVLEPSVGNNDLFSGIYLLHCQSCDIQSVVDSGSTNPLVRPKAAFEEAGASSSLNRLSGTVRGTYSGDPALQAGKLSIFNITIPEDKRIKKLTRNSTTPSVLGSGFWQTDNTVSTQISNLLDGVAGQQVSILIKDSFTSFLDGTSLRLNGSFATPSINSTLTLVFDGASWLEVSRSTN